MPSTTSKCLLSIFMCLLILLLSSCEDFLSTTLEVDLDEHTNQPVLNGILEVGQPITIDLFYSESALAEASELLDTSNIQHIKDAQIEVYENEQLIETLVGKQHLYTDSLAHLDKDNRGVYYLISSIINISYFRYVGTRAVQPNTTYTLKAISPTYGTITATTQTPPIIPLEQWQLTDTINMPDRGEHIECLLSFQDPNSQNYYGFQLMAYRDQYRDTYPSGFKSRCFMTKESSFNKTINNPFANPYNANRYCNDLVLFQDVLFSGQHKALSILIPLGYFDNKDKDISKRKVKLHLKSINSDFYQYRRSLSLQEKNNGIPFAEPVPVYSNTSTGMGILAAFASSEVVIESE